MATTAPAPIPIPFPPTRHERSALILYASETGTSEDAAHLLGGIAQRLRFATRVAAMDGGGVNVVCVPFCSVLSVICRTLPPFHLAGASAALAAFPVSPPSCILFTQPPVNPGYIDSVL